MHMCMAVDMLADDKGVPKVQVSSWSGYPGGAPCNVVCGLGQLKIPAAFVSAVGRDEKGDDLMKLMAGAGLQSTLLFATPSVYRIRAACVPSIQICMRSDDCMVSIVHARSEPPTIACPHTAHRQYRPAWLITTRVLVAAHCRAQCGHVSS